MKIFDTDILLDFLHDEPRAVKAVLGAGEDRFTTTINAAELHMGAELSNRPDDERHVVRQVLSNFRLVPFGPRAARLYGPTAAGLWKAGRFPGDMDVLVATIALAENATLVSRNRKHFQGIAGLTLETW